MKKRPFKDAPDIYRCQATVGLKDKTTAQCGRWGTVYGSGSGLK